MAYELFAVADTVANSDLVRTIIQLVAYVTPFFLIPATFKFGLGVFGNLAGRINDRSRGFFDGQRKKRMEVRAGNKQRMVQGERFNNRGLNALTSRATTKRLGFTAQGREAYQQKINNASADFAKSSAGQALQHNDGALQALTYTSRSAAQEGLRRGDFGKKSEAEIDASIAAAQASGGFGRNRQVWAAQQLANTGTGYENLEQVAKTISRAANGNESQAMALAGNINAATKSVGRGDLAPGFGKLSGLALAEMTGRSTYKDEKTGETGQYNFVDGEDAKRQRDQAYHKATLAASGSQDAMTLLRGKTPGVTNILKSLREEIETNPNNMAARSTVNDLINSMSYGPQPNQQELITMFSNHPDFSDQIESALQMQKQGRSQSQYDPNRDDRINPR
jgi:hypothetical protein